MEINVPIKDGDKKVKLAKVQVTHVFKGVFAGKEVWFAVHPVPGMPTMFITCEWETGRTLSTQGCNSPLLAQTMFQNHIARLVTIHGVEGIRKYFEEQQFDQAVNPPYAPLPAGMTAQGDWDDDEL